MEEIKFDGKYYDDIISIVLLQLEPELAQEFMNWHISKVSVGEKYLFKNGKEYELAVPNKDKEILK